jgi:hypothetical protein
LHIGDLIVGVAEGNEPFVNTVQTERDKLAEMVLVVSGIRADDRQEHNYDGGVGFRNFGELKSAPAQRCHHEVRCHRSDPQHLRGA